MLGSYVQPQSQLHSLVHCCLFVIARKCKQSNLDLPSTDEWKRKYDAITQSSINQQFKKKR